MPIVRKSAAQKGGLSAAKVGFAALTFVMCSLPALAATTGEVIHVSGTLSVTRADGSIGVLGQKSEVHPGDTLSTQKDSYAQINFSDGSSLTLRPLTQLKLDAYNYVADRPAADNVLLRLLKGGMRTVTGLIGKRGNQDAYRIGTTTATIGIRGSIGDTIVCEPSCSGVVKGGETLEQGTHHETHSGIYTMQVGEKAVTIEEGRSGFSNGAELKVMLGGIGGGKIDLNMPTGGLKGTAGCK
jgi:hypothetical protein